MFGEASEIKVCGDVDFARMGKEIGHAPMVGVAGQGSAGAFGTIIFGS